MDKLDSLKEKTNDKDSSKKFVATLFFVLFLIFGFAMILLGYYFTGFVFMILSLIVHPYTRVLIKNKFHFSSSQETSVPVAKEELINNTPEKSNLGNTQQSNVILCPKCGSNNIFISKKGFDAGSACCGAMLIGPFGLLCGQSEANKIEKTCLNCNKKF